QVPAAGHVFVGRRAGIRGFEFTGSVDGVRIESRAQPAAEIQAGIADRLAEQRRTAGTATPLARGSGQCIYERTRPLNVAGPLASLGMLTVLAFAGLWRGSRFALWAALGACVVLGATSGLWLLAGTVRYAMLPAVYILAGGLALCWAGRR